MCYVTHGSAVSEARRQLERRTAGAIVQYAVVQALPRDAQVEWHAWAHTDNNRFECESPHVASIDMIPDMITQVPVSTIDEAR